MILLLDNYDSFTFNLYQALSELGADVVVRRNDAVTVADVERLVPTLDGIVISPGPCTPVKPVSPSARAAARRVGADPRRLPRPSGRRRGLRRHDRARQDSCTARSR